MNKYEIEIAEIPSHSNYEGYLWWSDKRNPDLYLQDRILHLPAEENNPFIIEGVLVDKNQGLSYLIRFIDGKYRVFRYDPRELEKYEYEEKRWLAGFERMEHLCFRQYWIPERDNENAGFEVLNPGMLVFMGFNFK